MEGRHPAWDDLQTRLENYKSMHQSKMKGSDKYTEFMAARTLTQARKIAFGEKAKRISCSSCSHKDCVCGSGRRR